MLFDSLERRTLFAVNLGFDGVLSITGDLNKLGHPRADRIVVTQDFFDVTVIQNGETFGPFDSSEINEIDVEGGGGNDKILARAEDGSDAVEIQMAILGGSGNDTLEGGDNSDLVAGGSGKDWVAGGLGGDSVAGGPGNDRVNGSTFAAIDISEFDDDGDTLDGGSGHDVADYSSRLEGVFVSNDGVADDGVYGSDFFTGEPGPQELDNVLPNCEDIYGGEGDDALVGASGDSFIDGGMGDDALFGEIGNDTLLGGKGSDTLSGGTGADLLEGGSGDDALLGDYRFIRSSDFSPVFDFVPGPFLGDTLRGGDGDDIIRGGGDTYFATQSGNDLIDGGLGNDILFGDDGNDSILGGSGTDILEGDVGDDTLKAGNDDDLIINNTFSLDTTDADFVDGGDGFDIGQGDAQDSQPTPATVEFLLDVDTSLSAPSGAAVKPQSFEGVSHAASKPKVVTIEGTSKADAISITQIGSIVYASVNGVVTTYLASSVKRFNVEVGKGNDTVAMQTSKGLHPCDVPLSVNGAGGNDTIIGGSKADLIYGGDGDDSLLGSGGNDQLFGGLGDDTLAGGAGSDILNGGDAKIPGADGADVLSGGKGGDTADYRARTGNLIVNMSDDKQNDGQGGELDNVESDIENIFSGAGNDKLTGNAASNFISGGDGNDTIDGSTGDDKLFGGLGKDKVSGSDGIDLFLLQDQSRDDFDAPVNDLAFRQTEFVSGDELKDYSLLSQRFLGRSDSKQSA